MDAPMVNEEFISFDGWEIDVLELQPHAFAMLAKLKLAHEAHGKPFAISPRAMSRDRVLPWSVEKVRKARDTLLATGFIRMTQKGAGRRPNFYEFTNGRPDEP